MAILAALTAFVAAPLYRRLPVATDTGRAELEARRDVLLATLRELEIDRRSGLVAEDEYLSQRDAAETQAGDVLRRLESGESD